MNDSHVNIANSDKDKSLDGSSSDEMRSSRSQGENFLASGMKTLLETGIWLALNQSIKSATGKAACFIRGFVSGSLVFCVGAMAIMGALETACTGNHTTLFIKSIIDGITATVFASTMGIGVAFSALPVFLYQGAITCCCLCQAISYGSHNH